MTDSWTYIANFVTTPDDAFAALWNDLAWVRHQDAPRREYWSNDFSADYTYGRGQGVRTYKAQPWHPIMLDLRDRLRTEHDVVYEGCFLNGYSNESDALGWHADDSVEMDDARPIGVVSLGAEREIWFRPKGAKGQPTDRLLLGHGSLLLMHAGMQDTHEHRIPHPGKPCGPRVSLTYRGLIL